MPFIEEGYRLYYISLQLIGAKVTMKYIARILVILDRTRKWI